MKTKILSLVLMILFSVAAVTAATNFSLSTSSLTFEEPDTSKAITISATSATTVSFVTPNILDDDGNTIPITTPSTVTIAAGSSETVNLSTTVDYDDLVIGDTYSGTIVVRDTTTLTETEDLAVSFVPTFCKFGEASTNEFELSLSEVSVENDDGDDEEWSPLDEITVEVEVSNEGDDKVKDVFVELGVIDSDGKDVTSDLEFSNSDEEEIDVGSIDDGDEETVEFKFEVPADFEASSYRLVVKAYGDDEGEKIVCVSKSSDLDQTYYHDIDGEREEDEEDHIVVTDIRVSPTTAQCNERVQVQAEVFNIGDEDYEDQVLVEFEIKELGIDLESVIREDFDEGDSAGVEFEFDVPADAQEKSYTLEMRTRYDYNDRLDVYKIISDRRFTNLLSPFKVQGGCGVPGTGSGSGTPGTGSGGSNNIPSDVSVSAELGAETPEAVAGENLVVKTTLQNTGLEETTYTLSVFGNSAWSSLSSIDPQVVTLRPGESRLATITLAIDDSASGENEFTIRTSFDGKTRDQRVAVDVEDSSGSAGGDAFVKHLQDNWFIYLIVIVNVILIIAIIAVVRRMLSPRPL